MTQRVASARATQNGTSSRAAARDASIERRKAVEPGRPFAEASFAQLPLTPPRVGADELPARLRAGIERLSGVSMQGVRVHYRSSRPARLRAHAFTQGSDIHVAPGQERHLAHEAWHAAQQRRAAVRATHREQAVPVNESPALEREADLMGERAMLSGPGPAAASPVAPAAPTQSAQSPVQPKRIIRADGSIEEVDDDYELGEGERDLHEPAPHQLAPLQSSMRGALHPSGADPNPGGKFAFPFSFFDNAFPQQQSQVDITLRGGIQRRETVNRPSDTTTPARLLPMLPGSTTSGGTLERMLAIGDPSGHGATGSGGPPQISIDQLREAMTGLEYARQQNLDPASIHRPSATIDFGGTQRGTGAPFLFDPFMSPQPLAPTDKQLAGAQLHQRDPSVAIPGPFQYRPENPQALAGRRRRWARDTYLRHTDQSKGHGTVGLWDQTSDSSDDLHGLNQALHDEHVLPGAVHPIDLQLDREYAREDFLARQQVQHDHDEHFFATGDQRFLRLLPPRQRLPKWRELMQARIHRMDRRREREQQERQREERRKRRRTPPTEAPPWGGRRPDDPDDSGWGQNHPLYWRHGRRGGGAGGAGGIVA